MLTYAHSQRFIIILIVFNTFLVPSMTNAQESTTVGGYGELHYNEPDGAARGKIDFHRFIIYLSHAFNEKISFKSELELEHTRLEAGDDEGGELALEQAYLDWRLAPSFGIRAGILLPPVGIINLLHEPPTFNGVERPNVDRFIIPTTWRESGAGIYGTWSDGIEYQLYVMAGLKAQGFSGRNGIRGGRQKAFESSPTNPSFTGRVDYSPSLNLKLGGSFFLGNTTDGNEALGSGTFSMLSGDVRYTYENFSVRAVGAFQSLGDAEKINNASRDTSGNITQFVADQMYGYYVEGALDVIPWIAPESDHSLSPFIRYERYDTHAKVSGFPANPSYDRNEITVGATYKPTYNTAFKVDYQFFDNAAGKTTKQFNLGIGYNF